jgi:mycothiol synthase
MRMIEIVPDHECQAALASVLALSPGDRPASRAQVESFLQYMDSCRLSWRAWRCRRSDEITAYLLVLFLPGQTALFMLPSPEARPLNFEDQQDLVTECVKLLADNNLYFLQALLEPDAAGKRGILERAGFRYITRLMYTQRGVNAASPRPRKSAPVRWVSYSAETHGEFAQVLLATYEKSADCPELSGLRPIEAIIASHKAAGIFDPSLWELAVVEDEPAACLLLAPHIFGDLMEIVYLGVIPRRRGQGLGDELIRRAVEKSRAWGSREITAVVDERNAAARQLYARFAFKPTAAREAYLLLPRGKDAGQSE